MSLYLLVMLILFPHDFTFKLQLLTVFAAIIFTACISILKYMARASYSESGALLDGGLDLNMKEGFGEHVKDCIILTTIVQTLSLISSYFWLLWILAPIYYSYLLWVKLLGPWFFAPAPEVDQEREEKKQRKLDRKMRRMQ